MNLSCAPSRPVGSDAIAPYAACSLVSLLEQVVGEADQAALHELVARRTPCRIGHQPPMNLANYVAALCEMPWVRLLCGRDPVIVDRARDLTIDKLSHLPVAEGASTRLGGPDCRKFYASVLAAIREHDAADRRLSMLEREAAAVRILQRRVTSHVWLSCLDARRSSNPSRTRYAWQLDGHIIHVWMPATVPGQERRRWLEGHVPNPDPRRPDERCRIQTIVDGHFGVARFVTLPVDLPDHASPLPVTMCTDSPERNGNGAMDLAMFVADEKAERIAEQRPAIRALGQERLKALIRHVFQGLEDETYSEQAIANSFSLSKATLSRFAGSRWQDSERIPDLWRNTAQTLATHQLFIEIATDAGVWDRVIEILDGRCRNRKGKEDHD